MFGQKVRSCWRANWILFGSFYWEFIVGSYTIFYSIYIYLCTAKCITFDPFDQSLCNSLYVLIYTYILVILIIRHIAIYVNLSRCFDQKLSHWPHLAIETIIWLFYRVNYLYVWCCNALNQSLFIENWWTWTLPML